MTSTRTKVVDATDDRRASVRVLEAIAREEGTDPLEFDRRLGDVVDPDALDALFRSDDADGTIEFTYMGYRVRVSADGAVAVEPAE